MNSLTLIYKDVLRATIKSLLDNVMELLIHATPAYYMKLIHNKLSWLKIS